MGVDDDDVPPEDPAQDVEEQGVHKLERASHLLDVVLRGPNFREPAGVGAIPFEELLEILNSIQSGILIEKNRQFR